MAAESARARRAYGEAAALLDCALQAAQLNQKPDLQLRFDLLIEMGQVQYYAGQLNTAAQTLMEAALLAQRRQWWEQLGKTMCFFQLVCQQSGLHHAASVSLHRAVLENLRDADNSLRARVLTSLAKAYRTQGEPDLAARAFQQGVDLARLGRDPEVLLDCLKKGSWAIGRRPETLRKGLQVCREAYRLAVAQGQYQALLDIRVDTVFQLCDLGEIDEINQQLTALEGDLSLNQQPHFCNLLAGFQAALAILQGRWREAFIHARDGVKQVPMQGVRGLEGRFGFQVFAIKKAQGTLGEVAGLADRIISARDRRELWLPGQIVLHSELGQHRQAREVLDSLGDLYRIAEDDLRLIALVYLAEACTALGDYHRCEQLYRLLSPYRSLNATLPGTLMLGAVSGYLGRLAQATNRPAEALDLLEEAMAMNTRMGAAPALARCHADYAGLLLRTRNKEKTGEVLQSLAEARSIATRLGLRPVLEAVEKLDSGLAANTLTRRELDVLRLVARGTSNKQIAGQLHISYSTVATHLRNILRKSGARNRTEAVDWARQSEVLEQA
jgi:DNA-binding CsgD family transcriptional regulator